jgi:hypothetical protein
MRRPGNFSNQTITLIMREDQRSGDLVRGLRFFANHG